MEAYSEASKALFEVFDDTTPFVEGISIDEAFLDVGGLRLISGTPAEIAARLRERVRERDGLPVTVSTRSPSRRSGASGPRRRPSSITTASPPCSRSPG
jgi:DNA polymerase-4